MIDRDKPDADIEVFLMSPDRATRAIGYRMTQVRYCTPVTAFVQRIYGLCKDDADEVWQRTLMAFVRKVENKRYKATGYLAPLLFQIARRQSRRLLSELGELPECGGEYLDKNAGSGDVLPHRARELRAAVRRGFAGGINFTPWERVVITHWWKIVDKEGYEPTPTILTDSVFQGATEMAFGGDFYDDAMQRALRDAVKHVRQRALEKLRAYLIDSGYGPLL